MVMLWQSLTLEVDWCLSVRGNRNSMMDSTMWSDMCAWVKTQPYRWTSTQLELFNTQVRAKCLLLSFYDENATFVYRNVNLLWFPAFCLFSIAPFCFAPFNVMFKFFILKTRRIHSFCVPDQMIEGILF